MGIINLKAVNFRNLTSIQLEPSEYCNIFYGANGSGKTSLLEAVHYLGLGRSFRCHLLSRVIRYQTSRFSLFCEVQHGAATVPIGIERSLDIQQNKTRVSGENAQSHSELAKVLPLQLLNQDGYHLLNSGPKFRRKFIDWGLFHVEQSFFQLWKNITRILQQRNSLLKKFVRYEEIKLWDEEFAAQSVSLHELRRQYTDNLLPIAYDLITRIFGGPKIEIDYYAGWNLSKNLLEVLRENLSRDLQLGFTQNGPQRADLRFTVDGVPVQDSLSRGQQKLFFFAMQLAQGILLKQSTGKQCIYLIDDLPAELDLQKRKIIFEILAELQAQLFVTCLNPNELTNLKLHQEIKMFHVEHGNVMTICQ
jgi:DNA replication and repair protein RecF